MLLPILLLFLFSFGTLSFLLSSSGSFSSPLFYVFLFIPHISLSPSSSLPYLLAPSSQFVLLFLLCCSSFFAASSPLLLFSLSFSPTRYPSFLFCFESLSFALSFYSTSLRVCVFFPWAFSFPPYFSFSLLFNTPSYFYHLPDRFQQ